MLVLNLDVRPRLYLFCSRAVLRAPLSLSFFIPFSAACVVKNPSCFSASLPHRTSQLLSLSPFLSFTTHRVALTATAAAAAALAGVQRAWMKRCTGGRDNATVCTMPVTQRDTDDTAAASPYFVVVVVVVVVVVNHHSSINKIKLERRFVRCFFFWF